MELLTKVLLWMGARVLSSAVTVKLKVTIRSGGATIPANVYKVSSRAIYAVVCRKRARKAKSFDICKNAD